MERIGRIKADLKTKEGESKSKGGRASLDAPLIAEKPR
jgi:hypothetical protein